MTRRRRVVLTSFPMTETLTSAEAAERLGINVQKLHRLTADHGIEHAMKAPGLRGAKFWRRSDVEKLARKLAKERTA